MQFHYLEMPLMSFSFSYPCSLAALFYHTSDKWRFRPCRKVQTMQREVQTMQRGSDHAACQRNHLQILIGEQVHEHAV
jgi:hypothetical protein